MTRRARLMGTASYRGGIPKAEALDIAKRYLAGAAPTATGMTFISPDGEMRHVTRADADRHVAAAPPAGERKQ